MKYRHTFQVQAQLKPHIFWGTAGLVMWLGLPLLFGFRARKTRRLLEGVVAEMDRRRQRAIAAFPASLLDPQFRAVLDGLNKGADQSDERPDPTQSTLGTARRE